MENAKFTPGPWCVSERSGRLGAPAIFAADSPLAIADVEVDLGPHQRTLANARLIAAAPEMYEVLSGIASANQKDWDLTLRDAESFKAWAQSIARHVIAKAVQP